MHCVLAVVAKTKKGSQNKSEILYRSRRLNYRTSFLDVLKYEAIFSKWDGI